MYICEMGQTFKKVSWRLVGILVAGNCWAWSSYASANNPVHLQPPTDGLKCEGNVTMNASAVKEAALAALRPNKTGEDVGVQTANPCTDANCVEQDTIWQYYCKQRSWPFECGSPFAAGDDDYKSKRQQTRYLCIKPGGVIVFRVWCLTGWLDAGCCHNGINADPPNTCYGDNGEAACGSG